MKLQITDSLRVLLNRPIQKFLLTAALMIPVTLLFFIFVQNTAFSQNIEIPVGSKLNPALAAGLADNGISPDDMRFASSSLWQTHRWAILIIAVLLAAQFILITALLIQRRRRALADKSLKTALSRAEQGDRMLTVLMENIPEGISISDANLNLIRVSSYGMDLLGGFQEGKSVEEVISRWKVYQSDGVTPMPEEKVPLVRAIRYGETVRDMEVIQADISGKKIPLLCNAAPVSDAEGKITGGIVAWRDISEIKKAENEQLRISQQRQLALDAAKMGWWHYSPITGISYWDDRYREIFGVEGYSSPNSEILKRLHPDDLPKVWAKVEAALDPEAAQPYIAEYRICLPDGSMKWIEAHGIPSFENIDGTLKATSFVGTVSDITDRKVEQEALFEKMQEYSAVFDQSIVAKAQADPKTGRFLKVNRAFSDLTGFTPDELYKMTFSDLTHPEDRKRDLKGFEPVKKGSTDKWQIEKRYIRKDGTVIWVFVSGNLLKFEDSRPDRTIAVILDITERIRAEAELLKLEKSLRKSEERFRLALRNAPVSMTAQDRDLRYIWAYNQRTAKPGDIIGRFDRDIFTPEVAEHFTAIKKRILEQGLEHREQMWLERPGGKIYLDICWEPVIDENRNVTGVASATVDLTPLKLAEEALKVSLEEKDVLLKEIHHRVKNNMQVISSLVSLQAGQTGDAAVTDMLREVSNRVRSMAMIHEKLYQSENLSQVDFAQYTETLISYLWRSYGKNASQIVLEKELEQVFLSVDRAVPLGLILNELITNVLKHAFAECHRGKVTVTLKRKENNKVILSVRDSGKGLPEDLNWKEADTLGMRLVQMLASQIHADVEANSNGGCEFRVIF